MFNRYISKILKSLVYDVAEKTPLEAAPLLSKRLNNNIYFKREDLQPVFSFKIRGAYNKIANLPEHIRAKGIIAASAGNHAQGVALAASKFGIKAVIIMPETTPAIKVEAVKALGALPELAGDTYDEACTYAKKLEKEKNLTFIHPYDDPDVIAGQGTIAMEVLQQLTKKIHSIFIPVGGGGLIAGIAAYVKYVRPDITIIGVEPEDDACLYEALKCGKRVDLGQVGIFADGVAVKIVGRETFKICKVCVDEVITVKTDEICSAIKDIFEDTRAIVEPAGSLAVAGIKKYVQRSKIQNENIVAINSGANINFDRLRHISERAETGEQTEALLAVTIPEKRGSFKAFCKTLKNKSITEFNYRYSNDKQACVFVGLGLKEGKKEKDAVCTYLKKQGYSVLDMTDNEMAVIHLRHMVGGKCENIRNERVFRFQFPERPGALLKFLENTGSHWNFTLFHYRNHGAAYGRVFTGMQVPVEDYKKFEKFLKKLGYKYKEETDNAAYKLFL
ncbi:MAG: threonine ammonia-lyase, biosynthetic [bacterium]|nr:threonine ammonia-lyase, biosynthetic [bacterium]